MSFKDKFLEKSDRYNFYKKNYELYKEEHDARNLEKVADSFCNNKLVNFAYHEDFPAKLNDLLKNLPTESRNILLHIYLRAIAANMQRKGTLFTDEELKLQKKHQEFRKNNVKKNEICGYKFTTNTFNVHCFMNDFLTDKDKEFLKNKDIIDAGAYIGDSSIPFSKLTQKNVYAFEPFEDSYKNLVENIKLNNIKNIVPVNLSLSDKIGEENLYLAGDNIQGITNDSTMRKYDKVLKAKTMTIDEYVEKNNLDVGFIKVDVEGAEQKLIKGALNTIKTQKPIMFLSIYHNVNDFFEIKPLIESLNLGYTFKVSKERPETFIGDTILECRCED